MTEALADRQLIKALRSTGITAKRWRNTGLYTPPADVNFRGKLRVHTGVKAVLVATDEKFKQAVIAPTEGMYRGDSFLVGMDETSNFVCRLPHSVKSVQEAHDVLRPKGVMPHTIRQGEWFFVPFEGDTVPEDGTLRRNRQLETGTSHIAESLWEGNIPTTDFDSKGRPRKRYVRLAQGTITDNRPGRHAPVHLGEQWHEVFRNTEWEMFGEPAQTRRFD